MGLIPKLLPLYGESAVTQKTIEAFGTTWTYTLQSDFEPLVAAFVWGFMGALTILYTFIYWYWFNNGLIDFISFIGNAAIFGQNLLSLFWLSLDVNDEGGRGSFYYSSLITAFAPLLGWPITLGFYLVHGWIYWNDPKVYVALSPVTYIVVKNLLFLIWNLIVAYFLFETLFPVYGWWQVLARLAEKIPYTRPTEAEVLAADKLPTQSFDDFGFDDVEVDADKNDTDSPAALGFWTDAQTSQMIAL